MAGRAYYALVAEPAGQNRILLLPEGSDWSLPRFSVTHDHWWQDVAPVNQALRRQLGLPATTLNCVRLVGEEADETAQFFYALELSGLHTQLPADGRWIAAEALDELPLKQPEHREIIADWLRQVSNGHAAPWYRPGWRDGALQWARDQLARRGLSLTGTPEQVRSWERSSLWRFRTTGGTAYFKTVPQMFAAEPRLSQKLAEWLPDRFAPVLAIEPERNWLLMGDAGEKSLLRDPEAVRWEAALRQYAELQIALSRRTDEMLGLGLPDRRLEALPERIDALLADTAALKNGPTGLSDQEIAELRQRRGELHEACHQLVESGLPASLEHGDFASGQIIVGPNGGYRFIDWSDGSVSFPFFSLLFFWAELEGELDDPLEARVRLRQAYLEPWTAYAPMSKLAALYALAQKVAALHHALIYHRDILPHMQARWEMERMLPYYLRILLKGRV